MPHHTGEVIMAEVQLGPLGEALLFQHCARQALGGGPLPGRAYGILLRHDPTGTAQYHLTAQAWRPQYGGLTLSVVVPEGDSQRISAIFTDLDQARRVWSYVRSRRRSGVVIQKVGDSWYALMRFRPVKPRRRSLHARKGKANPIYAVLSAQRETRGLPGDTAPS